MFFHLLKVAIYSSVEPKSSGLGRAEGVAQVGLWPGITAQERAGESSVRTSGRISETLVEG